MVVTIIGAGTIGSAVAHALSQFEQVRQIQICDARPGALNEVKLAQPGHRLSLHQVDARNIPALRSLVRNSACLISCVGSRFNLPLVRLALSRGIHYCDMGGRSSVIADELSLDEQARKQGVWVVPNCGLSPGLVNILLLHGLSQFRHVRNAHVRVGSIPLERNPPLNLGAFFSPDKLIADYYEPGRLVRNGQVENVESLTGIESIRFTEPFGEMEAFHTSGVLDNLRPESVEKVDYLDHKTIHYPHRAVQMQFVFALGMAENRMVDVASHLTYRDILAGRIRRAMRNDIPDAVLVRVFVAGENHDGEQKTLVFDLLETYDSESGMTAFKRCSGISAAAVALLLGENRIDGAGAALPEYTVPMDDFLHILRSAGLKLHETWHNGLLDFEQYGSQPI